MPEELTALTLNNEVVKFRKTVEKAKVHLSRKLLHDAKNLRNKHGGSEQKKKKNLRKADRYIAELSMLKKLKRDGVTKLALVNTKKFEEFNIEGDTPPIERATVRLITCKLMQEAVAEFRKRYPSWHQTVPFLLQRLGLQYRKENIESPVPEIFKGDKIPVPIKRKPKADSKDDEPKSKKSRPVEAVKEGSTEKKKKILAKKSDIIKKKKMKSAESVVRPLDLTQISDIDAELPKTTSTIDSELHHSVPHSSFFVGGIGGDDEEKILEEVKEAKLKEKANKVAMKGLKKAQMGLKKMSVVDKKNPTAKAKQIAQTEDVHPSWAAKQSQKLKEKIQLEAPKSSKKIVFNDDSE